MEKIKIVLAGALWGTVGLFASILFCYGFSTYQVGAIRFILSAIFIIVFALFYDRRLFKIKIKHIFLFALTGLFNFLTTICYYNCISVSGASLACVLLYTTPFFVLGYSILFLRKKINAVCVLSIICCVVSCCFASSVFSAEFSLSGFLLGIASAVFNGAVTICSVKLIKLGYDGLSVSLYSFIFGGLISCFWIKSLFTALFTCGINCTLSCVFIALTSTVIPYSLYFASLKKVEEEKAVVLTSSEPFVATILESILLRCIPDKNVVFGLIGVFISVLTVSLRDKKTKKQMQFKLKKT
ncbi:MAG TPA: hypothetical protein DDW16_01460 [Clostridiales bacterium]|nr:hypothetical protein [Clostridiales bacterium]